MSLVNASRTQVTVRINFDSDERAIGERKEVSTMTWIMMTAWVLIEYLHKHRQLAHSMRTEGG